MTAPMAHIAPHPFYLRDDYIEASAWEGTLRSASGHKLLVLPEELIIGVHRATEHETGKALPLIMTGCGRQWGERLVRRWEQEWTHFYGHALADADFTAFETWLRLLFEHQGWGHLELEFGLEDEGLLEFRLRRSVFARLLADSPFDTVCHIFAGLLAAMTSRFAETELDAIEIACERSGAPCCRFIVAVPERVESARALALDGASSEQLLAELRKPR
ncbi:MAG: hypothetical protein EA398_03655 [Deltaproteobacteria bacterium]|nr:MAG: hypothetical protein EA398_03655 [Deltaproteobacteria bacterium]